MKRPRHPSDKSKRGRKLKTYELTNIERPVTTKMKPLRSGVVVKKKRGTRKVPHAKSAVKFVSTAETRSIARAKTAVERSAREAAGHRRARKIKTAKFTNIAEPRSKARNTPTEPKAPKKSRWYS